MKKSITLALSDEELLEASRILQDEDEKEALRFLSKHLKGKLREVMEGLGHCKPWFDEAWEK